MSKYASTIKDVPLGKMTVLPTAQRDFNQDRVNALLREFDVDLVNRLVVSDRDGSFHLIDGQHRWRALQDFLGPGWETQKVPCVVHTGLTDKDEADLFLKYNNTLTVRMVDKFLVGVTAGRELETAVARVVRNNGLKISKNRNTGGISAVGVLRKVLVRSDEMVLGRALRIIRDSFGDSGLDAAVIDGIAHLCQRYNGSLDEQHAKEKLGATRGGVKGLLNRAEELRLRTGHSKAPCVAAAAVDIINSGRGGPKKLPSWWAE